LTLLDATRRVEKRYSPALLGHTVLPPGFLADRASLSDCVRGGCGV